MSIARIINISLPLLALLCGIYSFKKLDKSLRVVLTMVGIGLVTELSVWVAVKMGSRNTIPGLHFYIMAEFFFWAMFYLYQLEGFIKKNYVWYIILVFEILCVLNFMFVQDLTEYPSTRAFEGLIISLFSILVFYRILIEERIKKLLYSPVVWINTVVLFYFSSNLFFHLVFNLMLINNSEDLKFLIKYVFVSLNAIFYTGIAGGFLIQKLNYQGKKILW
jgi:hypothetical protein